MFKHAPDFLTHAERLADLFSLMPGISAVALTGSLARSGDREKANDIDLVLLHDGSFPDGAFSVVRGEATSDFYGTSIVVGWRLKEGEDLLKKLFGDRAHAIRRYIKEEVPCKVDIICANAAVLTDCEALRSFSVTDCDPDFSRRIFCEIPLLQFDLFSGAFKSWDQLKHKDGSCCKPRITWETVRKLREYKLDSLLNLISR